MKKELYEKVEKETREFFKKANIVVTDKEEIEIVDFGLDMVYDIGL